MPHPFNAVDRWASDKVERMTFLVWITGVAMATLVVVAVVGMVWITSPTPA